MSDLLQQGIKAYQTGNLKSAREIFTEIIKQSPSDEHAWEWMYKVSNTDRERILCLLQVIKINPNNKIAHEILLRLESPKLATKQTQEPARERQKSVKISIPFLAAGMVLFLLLLVMVFFCGVWIQSKNSNKSQVAPTENPTAGLISPLSPTLEQPTSVTPRAVTLLLRTPRPTFTPYPTNTIFYIPTWTSTPEPLIQAIPVVISTPVPQATGKLNKIPLETPKTNPTPRSNPTKTLKPDITIQCDVSPDVIQVGRNTTLSVFAQLYQDGKAIKTMALNAEWKDYLHHNFYCLSSGNSCQGQSGYLVAHVQSIIEVGVNSASGERFNCQAIYRTP